MPDQKEHQFVNEVVFVQRDANGDVLARVTYEQFFNDKEGQINGGNEMIGRIIPAMLEWAAEKGQQYLERVRSTTR